MTIRLGPISGVTMHFTTDDGLTSIPRALCQQGGAPLMVGVLNTFTSDPAKVTCTGCIEWMHA